MRDEAGSAVHDATRETLYPVAAPRALDDEARAALAVLAPRAGDPVAAVLAVSAGLFTLPLIDHARAIPLMRVHPAALVVVTHGPLPPGGPVAAAVRAGPLVDAPFGHTLDVTVDLDEGRVARLTLTVAVRGPRKAGRAAASAPRPPVDAGRARPFPLDPALGAAWARASGDENPLFLDDEAARLAGLPRRALSALALAAHVTARLPVVDDARGARHAFTFGRPAFPPEAASLAVDDDGARATVRGEDGAVLLDVTRGPA